MYLKKLGFPGAHPQRLWFSRFWRDSSPAGRGSFPGDSVQTLKRPCSRYICLSRKTNGQQNVYLPLPMARRMKTPALHLPGPWVVFPMLGCPENADVLFYSHPGRPHFSRLWQPLRTITFTKMSFKQRGWPPALRTRTIKKIKWE